jgi:cyclophilin family peptidyl-prolyl cis-trans isomerase/HEAT repeat protein
VATPPKPPAARPPRGLRGRRTALGALLCLGAPLVLWAAAGCGGEPNTARSAGPGPSAGAAPAEAARGSGASARGSGASDPGSGAASVVDARDLYALADARRLDPALRQAALDPDPGRREAALLALARLHAPEAAADLRLGLRDHAPAVRRAAALGLGAFEDDAPAGTATALLGALAVEPDPETRAALLFDLGRVARDAELPGLEVGLRAADPREREGACRGAGNVALRGRSVPPALLRLVLSRASGDQEPVVRARCAFALGRLPPPPDPEAAAAVVAALPALAADADADVRAQAARLFGRYATAPVAPLRALAADPDPAVAVAAFRALARRSTPATDGAYAQALRERLDRTLPPASPATAPPRGAGTAADGPGSGRSASGPGSPPPAGATDAPGTPEAPVAPGPPGTPGPAAAHVLRVALEEALPLGTGVNVGPLAQLALDRLALLPTSDAPSASPAAGPPRARALAACAAAAVVDVGRGWPQRVLRCGEGLVTASEQQSLAAAVVGAAPGDPAGRAGYLQRLYDRGDVRVRQATLAAVVHVDDPAATRLVLRALRDSDPGVVTAALEAAAQIPARLRDLGAQARPTLPADTIGIDNDTQDPAADPGAPRALPTEVRAVLLAALSTLRAADALEGLLSLADVAAALRDPALAAPLRPLRAHPSATLRARVASALSDLGDAPAHVASDAPAPTPAYAPLGAAALPLPSARLFAEVTVRSPPRPPETSPPAPARDPGRASASAAGASAASAPGAGLPAAADPSARTFTLRLRPDLAPTTVARFVQLARAGFFDGLTFHRVVPGFVVQGGDPRGDGYGGPDFVQRCEDARTPYVRGTVGMALAGRDTGGSQFFIALAAQPHLDGRYTAFAEVARGMDAVDAILPGDVIDRVRIVETPPR